MKKILPTSFFSHQKKIHKTKEKILTNKHTFILTTKTCLIPYGLRSQRTLEPTHG